MGGSPSRAVRGPGERELIRVVDPRTGRPIGRPARQAPGWHIRALALGPDGRRFATGSNIPDVVAGEVRLWDTSSGRLLFPPMPHTNNVSALAFRPDGKVLAAGDYHGLVRLWDTSTGREVSGALLQRAIVMSLVYSPDGERLVAGLAGQNAARPSGPGSGTPGPIARSATCSPTMAG